MRQQLSFFLVLAISLLLAGCNAKVQTSEVKADSTVTQPTAMQTELFGKLPDGKEVNRYVLKNKNGLEIHVINYGAIITKILAPDRNGKLEDIVLGYDSLDGYLKETPYFGAIVGRYGNRIANGRFKIDGTEYTLVQNNNGQHLHGGTKGFDKVFWNIGQGLKLSYLSKDMEEGYPGNLAVTVEYVLTEDNTLEINYSATTDKKTIVNLTQHTYFNLTGNGKRDILDHELTLNADRYVPVSNTLIPTGKLQPVKGTPFDFTTSTPVGKRINEQNEQLKIAGGYDHCWVLSSQDSVKNAGLLYEPSSGRTVEVLTTEPGIQFYSGNFLTGSITGKAGVNYKHRFGLCLETEHFPDSPNQQDFPSVLLSPGETYKTFTAYRFGFK
jgi:aldose 1-epimerase